MAKQPTQKSIDAIKHDSARCKNIPTAEYPSVLDEARKNPQASMTSSMKRPLFVGGFLGI